MSVELLAPAGSYAKFLTALQFGADAVYLGGKQFSLRTFADNFTEDELASAVKIAHEMGKKVYVAANVFAKNADFTSLEGYVRSLESIGVDAAAPGDVTQSCVVLRLSTGEALVSLVGVTGQVSFCCESGCSQSEDHDQGQQNAGNLSHVFHSVRFLSVF